MFNYSIVKFNGSTITGQADTFAAAVANVNRMRLDQWYTEGRPFAAAYVGNDTELVQLAIAADGITYRDPRGTLVAGQATTFASLPVGSLFRFGAGGVLTYRKHDDNTGRRSGKLPFVVKGNRSVVFVCAD